MIKYLVLPLLLALSCNSYAISNKEATKVFNDVYKTFFYKYSAVRVKFIIEKGYNNAHINKCGKITYCVTTGDVFLSGHSKGSWAAVAGHELSHYYLNHFKEEGSHQQELNADYLGVLIANGSGYNGCELKQHYLDRAWVGDVEAYKDSSHPAYSTRAINLTMCK